MSSLLGWLRGRPGAIRLGGSLAVVSPHLDDAVLSVGAALAAAVRSGSEAIVVTVLAGDVDSTAPAGVWDKLAGFRTEGEAAISRRAEDERACRLLGARPVWLPFGDDQYERGATEDEVYARLVDVVAGAQTVLVPGRPLVHPDHRWIHDLVEGRGLSGHTVLRYLEQPYASNARRETPTGDLEALYAEAQDRFVKLRACGAYPSQMRLLGRRELWQSVLYEMGRGGESVLKRAAETM